MEQDKQREIGTKGEQSAQSKSPIPRETWEFNFWRLQVCVLYRYIRRLAEIEVNPEGTRMIDAKKLDAAALSKLRDELGSALHFIQYWEKELDLEIGNTDLVDGIIQDSRPWMV